MMTAAQISFYKERLGEKCLQFILEEIEILSTCKCTKGDL